MKLCNSVISDYLNLLNPILVVFFSPFTCGVTAAIMQPSHFPHLYTEFVYIPMSRNIKFSSLTKKMYLGQFGQKVQIRQMQTDADSRKIVSLKPKDYS